MAKSFIPVLGKSGADVITTDKDHVEYLLAFTLINPGNTMDSLEDRMLAYAGIMAGNIGDYERSLEIYKNALLRLIIEHLPHTNYEVEIITNTESEDGVNKTASIYIRDASTNENIIELSSMADLLKISKSKGASL